MSKAEEVLKEVKEIVAKEKGYDYWEICINDQPNWMVEKLMDEVANKAMKAYAEKFGEWLLKESYLPKENDLWYQVKPPYANNKTTAQLIEMFEQEV